MKKIKVANIFCQISSDLSCFSLKVFLGTDKKTEEGSDLFIPSGSSFEDIK